MCIFIVFYLHATNIRIAVAVMLPGDLFQQPVIPVQKAAKIATNDRINNAMTERPISEKKKQYVFYLFDQTVTDFLFFVIM